VFTPDQYELLDFGQGRKLERFGAYLLDRPAPAADGVARGNPAIWRQATARYERVAAQSGVWRPPADDDNDAGSYHPWTIRHGSFALELTLTEFGHLGVFPEQAANWDWIARQISRFESPTKVLNLFAYTGASTLAAAAAGAEVVHVDAARNTVAWARRNAERSSLADRPIRWIADDTLTFVRRELRRGRRYQAVLLDPPSYGHGTKGQPWQIAEHLPELLALCAEITADDLRFFLLTCHTPGFGPSELSRLLSAAIGQADAAGSEMAIVASDGRRLSCGAQARWPG
jgi:23S rRNA (cytosine1962-C5)-methyltransferase